METYGFKFLSNCNCLFFSKGAKSLFLQKMQQVAFAKNTECSFLLSLTFSHGNAIFFRAI